MTPSYWNDATHDLASRDPVLKVLIRNHAGPQLQSRSDAFMTLALIFFMMRPNILPLDDIGLHRAMGLYYNNGKPLSKRKIRQISNEWQPWRTVATWYLGVHSIRYRSNISR